MWKEKKNQNINSKKQHNKWQRNNPSSSILKKYQFFEDEEAYIDIPNKNKNQQPQSNSENKSNDKTKLKLSDISPSGISQMQSVEGVIFICGKALHKIKSKMIE